MCGKHTIRYFVFIGLIAVGSMAAGCLKKDPAGKQQGGPQIIPVKVSPVELKDIRQSLDYVGTIKAQDEVLVYPKVTGKIIEKVKKEGDPAAKGDPIVYVDRDEVGLTFNKAPVESPLDGFVGRVHVDIGSNVSPQTPVALVIDWENVKIKLDIPEIYAPKIYVNQLASVTTDAYPSEVFKGKIVQISPVVNQENRAIPIEILIGNTEHRLKSGMFARVSLVIEEHTGVPVILKEAVIGKAPDTYVYVIEDKKAKLRRVSLGIRQGAEFEVREGLQKGDHVVIVGQQRLSADALVTEEFNGNNKKDK